MTTRERVFEYVDEMIGTLRDNPWEGDFDSTVLRHKDTKKWFGLVMKAPSRYFYGEEKEGYEDALNVKCDPFLRDLLKDNFGGIYPAWHMNKIQWASIPLSGTLPEEEVFKLLSHSFALTEGKKK